MASQDVLVFIREAVQRFHNLRPIVLNKMIEVFPAIKNVKIFRAALWILGEYCSTSEEIQNVMTLTRQSLGEVGVSVCSQVSLSLCCRDWCNCVIYFNHTINW